MELKKFLDATGVSYLWQKISEEFINGEELTAVVNAIDESKEDVDNKVSTVDEAATDITYPSTLAIKTYVDNFNFESEVYVGDAEPADEDKLLWFNPTGEESEITGATFIPSVDSESGVISWTNDRGLENPEPVNITGPAGPEGPQGEQGPAPTKGTDYWTEEDKTAIINEVIQDDKVISNVVVITVPASGWVQATDGYTQSIAVNGISANETEQLIHIDGYNSSLEASKAASTIYCTAQAENSLTFTTENIPTVDVQFIVEWKYINYLS